MTILTDKDYATIGTASNYVGSSPGMIQALYDLVLRYRVSEKELEDLIARHQAQLRRLEFSGQHIKGHPICVECGFLSPDHRSTCELKALITH